LRRSGNPQVSRSGAGAAPAVGVKRGRRRVGSLHATLRVVVVRWAIGILGRTSRRLRTNLRRYNQRDIAVGMTASVGSD
jgi:hypothetical protein